MGFLEIKQYKVLAGTAIGEAIREAMDIVDGNSIITFDFNGVKMEIYSNSTFEECNEYFEKNV